MAYCREEGKDKIIFATKEELYEPSTAQIVIPLEEQGAILPNGEINWQCPCLGGMATTGPCMNEFREAFSCFHFSEDDPKGSDCYEQFESMSKCFTDNPDFYRSKEEKESEDKIEDKEDSMKKELDLNIPDKKS